MRHAAYWLLALIVFGQPAQPSGADPGIAELREQLAAQQRQIDELRAALEQQQRLLSTLLRETPPVRGESPPPANGAAELPSPAGLKLSGDFRYRLDVHSREGNAVAGAVQNIRARYRLRLNMDRELHPWFRFHAQLATGPYNSGTSNEQDFAGMVAKDPFSISEAYVDFHPSPRFSLRGGRMEEVFADQSRFLWDDDVRFNGFHQISRFPLRENALGVRALEFRTGAYIFSSPGIMKLPENSPLVLAGYRPGERVGSANLFHPGLVARGDIGPAWSYSLVSDLQVYRNAHQIQLASLASGYPVLVTPAIGVSPSGPMTGRGNATTAPDGARYHATTFQVLRLAYRLERNGVRVGHREMPGWVDFQVSRNLAAAVYRDAVMASANLGAVRTRGDMRFLYQFGFKDANSMVSQFTDDNLGTASGVNIRVHGLRFDLGLSRFLQLQNLFFIQNQLRGNRPAENFFVPLPHGAKTTFRYLGQLAFTF